MYVIMNYDDNFLSEVNRYKNVFLDSIKEAMIFDSEDEAKAMLDALLYTENSIRVCKIDLQGVW